MSVGLDGHRRLADQRRSRDWWLKMPWSIVGSYVALLTLLLTANFAAACTLQQSPGALSPGAALVELPDGRFRVSLWGSRGVGGFGLRQWLVHGPGSSCWTAGIDAATGQLRGAGSPHSSCGTGRTAAAVPSGGAYVEAGFGELFGCALRAENRTVVCWGDPTNSKLDVPPLRGPFRRLAVGRVTTCAIELGSSLGVCWGQSSSGVLGISTNITQDRALKMVVPGEGITCYIESATGAIGCVGSDTYSNTAFPQSNTYQSLWLTGYTGASYAVQSDLTLVAWGYGPYRAPPAGRGPYLEQRAKPGTAVSHVVEAATGKIVTWGYYAAPYAAAIQAHRGPWASVDSWDGNACTVSASSRATYCWGGKISPPLTETWRIGLSAAVGPGLAGAYTNTPTGAVHSLVIITDMRRLRRMTLPLNTVASRFVGSPAVGTTVAAYAFWDGVSAASYAWRLLSLPAPGAAVSSEATVAADVAASAPNVTVAASANFTLPLSQLECGTGTCCARFGALSNITCRGRTQLDLRGRTNTTAIVSIAVTGDCVLAVNVTGGVELLGAPSGSQFECNASLLLPPAALASGVTFISIAVDPAGTFDPVDGNGAAPLLASQDDGDRALGSMAVFGVTSDNRVIGWGSRWAGELLRIPFPLTDATQSYSLPTVTVSGGTACVQATLRIGFASAALYLWCWGHTPGRAVRLYEEYAGRVGPFSVTASPIKLTRFGFCGTFTTSTGFSAWYTCLGAPPLASPTLDALPAVLSVGNEHGLALLPNGSAVAWGADDAGQSSAPIAAAAALRASGSDPISVATSGTTSCVLGLDGRVTCAGPAYNATAAAIAAQNVLPTGAGPACSLSVSAEDVRVAGGPLSADVSVRMATGQVNSNSTAVLSSLLSRPLLRVYARAEFVWPACAIDEGGDLACSFGASGLDGELPAYLGGGTHRPAAGAGPFVHACVGNRFFCGLQSTSRGAGIVCFGPHAAVAANVPSSRAPFFDLTCSYASACAVAADRNLVCWGDPAIPAAETDDMPNILPQTMPVNGSFARGSPDGAVCITEAVGSGRSTLRCYGAAASNVLYRMQPSVGTLFSSSFLAVFAGPWWACGIGTGGFTAAVTCWGERPVGPTVPVTIIPGAGPWTMAAVGWVHSCFVNSTMATLRMAGSIFCYGDSDYNRTMSLAAPAPLSIAAGSVATCVVSAVDRTLSCFGGSLNAAEPAREPSVSGVRGAIITPFNESTLCMGRAFVCAVTSPPASVRVRCFNTEGGGELLVDLTSTLPSSLSPPDGIAKISCGGEHVCALSSGGQLACGSVRANDTAPASALTVPTAAGGSPLTWTDVTTTLWGTCAVQAGSRRLYCFGLDSWTQGPVAVISRHVSPTGNRTALVGGPYVNATNTSCAFNYTCADLAQAARFVHAPHTRIRLLDAEYVLTTQIVVNRACYNCTISGAPTRLRIPAYLTPVHASSRAAVVIQARSVLEDVTFDVLPGSGSAAPAGSIPLAALLHLQQPQLADQTVIRRVSMLGLRAGLAGFVMDAGPGSSSGSGSVVIINATVTAGTSSASGALSLGSVVVSDAADTVVVTNMTVSSGAASTLVAWSPQSLLQISNTVSVQLSGITVSNGNFSAVVAVHGVDLVNISSLRLTNAVAGAAIVSTDVRTLAVTDIQVTAAVLAAIILAPADASVARDSAARQSIRDVSVTDCTAASTMLSRIAGDIPAADARAWVTAAGSISFAPPLAGVAALPAGFGNATAPLHIFRTASSIAQSAMLTRLLAAVASAPKLALGRAAAVISGQVGTIGFVLHRPLLADWNATDPNLLYLWGADTLALANVTVTRLSVRGDASSAASILAISAPVRSVSVADVAVMQSSDAAAADAQAAVALAIHVPAFANSSDLRVRAALASYLGTSFAVAAALLVEASAASATGTPIRPVSLPLAGGASLSISGLRGGGRSGLLRLTGAAAGAHTPLDVRMTDVVWSQEVPQPRWAAAAGFNTSGVYPAGLFTSLIGVALSSVSLNDVNVTAVLSPALAGGSRRLQSSSSSLQVLASANVSAAAQQMVFARPLLLISPHAGQRGVCSLSLTRTTWTGGASLVGGAGVHIAVAAAPGASSVAAAAEAAAFASGAAAAARVLLSSAAVEVTVQSSTFDRNIAVHTLGDPKGGPSSAVAAAEPSCIGGGGAMLVIAPSAAVTVRIGSSRFIGNKVGFAEAASGIAQRPSVTDVTSTCGGGGALAVHSDLGGVSAGAAAAAASDVCSVDGTQRSSVHVSTSTFAGNSALRSGGAVFLSSSSDFLMNATNTSWADNVAVSEDGGALFLGNAATVQSPAAISFTAVSCIFDRNVAARGGGAVAVAHDSGLVVEARATTFRDNTARTGAGGGFQHGLWRSAALFSLAVALIDVQAVRCSAPQGFGGFASVASATVFVRGGRFTGNSAAGEGGAIYALSSSLSAGGAVLFDGNSALRGGALKLQAGLSRHVLLGAQFTNNSASDVGGGLAVDGAEVLLSRVGFDGCGARYRGGAVHVTGETAAAVLLSVRASRCYAASASVDASASCGGCISVSGVDSLLLADTLLSNCSSSGDGGGLCVTDTQRVLVLDSSIDGGAAANGWGGGIGLSAGAIVSLENSTVRRCTARAGAGAALLGASTLLLGNGSLLTAGFATVAGGGAFTELGAATGTSKLQLIASGNTAVVSAARASAATGLLSAAVAARDSDFQASSSSSSAFAAFAAPVASTAVEYAGMDAVSIAASAAVTTPTSWVPAFSATAATAQVMDANVLTSGDPAWSLLAARVNGNGAALYGPQLATTASRIVDLLPVAVRPVLAPGVPALAPLFTAAVVDAVGSVAVLDSFTCVLEATDEDTGALQPVSRTGFTSVNGVINATNLAISGVFGTNLTLTFTCVLTAGGTARQFVLSRRGYLSYLAIAPLISPEEIAQRFSYVLYNSLLPPLPVCLVDRDNGVRVVGLQPKDTSCDLVSGLLNDTTVAGSTWRTLTTMLGTPLDEDGSLSFDDVRVQPPPSHSGWPAHIRVRCTFRGIALRDLSIPTTFDGIGLAWAGPPPQVTLPSARNPITKLGGAPLRFQLMRSASNRSLTSDPGAFTQCTARIAQDATVQVSSASAAATLVGTVAVNADVNGSIVFNSLGVDADLGATIALEVACVRSLGGADPTLRHTLRVLGLSIVWTAPPQSIMYSYSPFSVAVKVVDGNGSALTHALLAGASGAVTNGSVVTGSTVDVVCALGVVASPDSSVSASSAMPGVALIGEASIYYKALDMELTGSVSYPAALRPMSSGVSSGPGPEGRYGYLSVVCTLGLRTIESPRLPVLLPRLGVALLSPPPARWLPSTPTLREPLRPPPLLSVFDSAGRSVSLEAGVTCSATLTRLDGVDTNPDDTALLNLPAGGFSYSGSLQLMQAFVGPPSGSSEEADDATGLRLPTAFPRDAWVWSRMGSPWVDAAAGEPDVAAVIGNLTAPGGGYGSGLVLPGTAEVVLPRNKLTASAIHGLPPAQPVAAVDSSGVVRRTTAGDVNASVAAGSASAYALAVNSSSAQDSTESTFPVQAIALNLIPQALALNASVRLCLTCARVPEDPSNSLCIERRIRPVTAVMVPQEGQPLTMLQAADQQLALTIAFFPRGIAPSQVFNASLQLMDRDTGELLEADSVTSCDLSLLRPPDSGTRVIAPTAVSEVGVVAWPSITLAARPGSSVNVSVRCNRGGVSLPVLPTYFHEMSVLACPAGQVGRTGSFACDICSEGSYTDGLGEAECIRCPLRVATCSAGRLALNPGFWISPATITYASQRPPSAASSVAASTDASISALNSTNVGVSSNSSSTARSIYISAALEVHECWQPDACVMSEADRTFGCAEGYDPKGPFCGVCDDGYARSGRACKACPPIALNWFVVALLPVGLLSLGIWAAGRKLRQSDPQAPILRIGLSYVQILGTLATGFIARGTQTFRDLFGVTEVASGGPLTIPPVSCALNLSWYLRFALTLLMPLVMAIAVVIGRSIMDCVDGYRKRTAAAAAKKAAALGRRAAGPTAAAGTSGQALPPAQTGAAQLAVFAAVGRTGSRQHGRSPAAAARAAAGTPQEGASTSDAKSPLGKDTEITAVNPLASMPGGATAPLTPAAAQRSNSKGSEVALRTDSSNLAEEGNGPKRSCCARLCSTLGDPLYVGPVVFVLSLSYTVSPPVDRVCVCSPMPSVATDTACNTLRSLPCCRACARWRWPPLTAIQPW